MHWSCKPGVGSSNLSEGYFHCYPCIFPPVEYYSQNFTVYFHPRGILFQNFTECVFSPQWNIIPEFHRVFVPSVEYYSRISPGISPTVEYYSRISPVFSPAVEYYSRISPCIFPPVEYCSRISPELHFETL